MYQTTYVKEVTYMVLKLFDFIQHGSREFKLDAHIN